jgi:hypothetical protein
LLIVNCSCHQLLTINSHYLLFSRLYAVFKVLAGFNSSSLAN